MSLVKGPSQSGEQFMFFFIIFTTAHHRIMQIDFQELQLHQRQIFKLLSLTGMPMK
jgi:hypothetical protein